MSRIFVVYRQSDSGTIARQIVDRLAAIYGPAAVLTNFQDAPPNVNLQQETYRMVTTSAVVLAIIGPSWANDPRLYRPDDMLRYALETALMNPYTRLIPVLVGGAVIPNPQLLPPGLQMVTARGVVNVRSDAAFEQDMQALMTAVQQAMRPAPTAPAPAPRPTAPPRRVEPLQEPIPIVQREIVRRETSGCLMWPVRVLGGTLNFLGSLVAVIVRTMLASIVSFVMGIVLIALSLVLVVLFGQAMLASNLDVGLSLSLVMQQISAFFQSIIPPAS
jgi:hypothetical protein